MKTTRNLLPYLAALFGLAAATIGILRDIRHIPPIGRDEPVAVLAGKLLADKKRGNHRRPPQDAPAVLDQAESDFIELDSETRTQRRAQLLERIHEESRIWSER